MTVQIKNLINNSTKGTKRLYYLDNLRVALTVLVIAHHASQAYAPLSGSWPISNSTKSAVLDPFQAVNVAFFMGLFFLIGGYFVPGAYDRKGARVFLKTRAIRLGIPTLLFAMFVFGPMEYFSSPDRVSLIEFIRHLYQTGWQNLYIHLWFLLHLLVYSVGYAFWRLITKRLNHPLQPELKLPWHAVFLVFGILLILFNWVVRLNYTINQWVPLLYLIPAEIFHLPQYIGMFVLGILAYRLKAFERLPTPVGLVWLGIGMTAAGWFYMDWLFGESFMRSQAINGKNLGSLVWSTWEALTCVGLGIGLLILFREWINRRAGRLITAITRAQYGAYIIHFLIILGVQAGLASLPLPAFFKFLIATLLGAMLSFGISHFALKIPGVNKMI